MEEATLIVLCRQSPSKIDNLIHISREAISKRLNIKDLDTVSKYTKKLVTERYISKVDGWDKKGHNLVKYRVNKPLKYRLIGNEMYYVDPKLAVFVTRLSDWKFDNTNFIYMSNRELAQRIGIAERTFYKYIKEAVDAGIVDRTSEGYVLNSSYFPPIVETDLSYDEANVLTTLLKSESKRQANQAEWYLTKQIFTTDRDRTIYNQIVSNTFKMK